MKLLVLFIVLVVGPISHAQMDHAHPALPNDPPATHGMLLFGNSKIYLSHLPMFHRPHNYQVLLEADLDESGGHAYEKSRQDFPEETIYTLVPEPFSLPAMIQNPKPFKAQLFRGHFERGGVPITAQITVTLKQIIYFKKLNETEEKPSVATYLLFGVQNELFMTHFISAKPDFDQILTVRATDPVTSLEIGSQAKMLKLPDQDNSPVSAPKTVRAEMVGGTSPQLQLDVQKELYLEFNDLSF